MAVRTITGKNVSIISDPEGLEIPNIKDEEELYICGDLIDSTVGVGVTPDNFYFMKKYNLHNIQQCIKKDNVFLAFGNRDLNKLKCKYMCVLKNVNDDTIINNFNKGHIDLTYKTYLSLKKKLNITESIWTTHHKNWYPYWNTSNPIFKKDNLIYNDKKKYWTTNEDTNFLDRYNKIFGQDPAFGTMGAQNLIHTIPLELNLVKLLNNKFSLNDDSAPADLEDYKAFVTLAVFRSMCIYDYKMTPIKKINEIINTYDVKGWLTQLYEKHHACYMLTDDSENIYLLSHGGITSTLIQEPEKLEKMRNNLNQKDLKNLLNDSEQFYKSQIGGYYNKYEYTDEIQNFNLTDKINKINDIIKESLTEFNKTENILNQSENAHIAFLLTIATGFNCDKYKDLLKDDVKDKFNCDDILDPQELGPIMPGIENMRNKNLMFIMRGRTIYQIIGHKPIGINTIVDYFENGKDKSILINLDISNTFVGTKLNNLKRNSLNTSDNINKSSNQLKINNNKVDLISYIEVVLKEFDIQNISKLNISELDKIVKPTIYHSGDNTFTGDSIDVLSINTIDDTFLENVKKIKNKFMSYTGMHNDKKSYYHLITHMNLAYKMIIFILSDEDLDKLAAPQAGAGGSYYKKYLKYKNKYLNLKKLI